MQCIKLLSDYLLYALIQNTWNDLNELSSPIVECRLFFDDKSSTPSPINTFSSCRYCLSDILKCSLRMYILPINISVFWFSFISLSWTIHHKSYNKPSVIWRDSIFDLSAQNGCCVSYSKNWRLWKSRSPYSIPWSTTTPKGVIKGV